MPLSGKEISDPAISMMMLLKREDADIHGEINESQGLSRHFSGQHNRRWVPHWEKSAVPAVPASLNQKSKPGINSLETM